jgi:mRNA interferase MazF
MHPHPGEVWLADLGLAAKTRPVVIVSRHDPDPPRALVLYVPLTTQDRRSSYEVPLPRLPFLDRESVANVQGLGSVPVVRLERRLGTVQREVLAEIRKAIAFALDMAPQDY